MPDRLPRLGRNLQQGLDYHIQGSSLLSSIFFATILSSPALHVGCALRPSVTQNLMDLGRKQSSDPKPFIVLCTMYIKLTHVFAYDFALHTIETRKLAVCISGNHKFSALKIALSSDLHLICFAGLVFCWFQETLV
jgi:hypothetical protein